MAADAFAALQRRLPDALAVNTPDSATEHVVVALPSYSVGESLLSHYVDRIPALEHRYLVSLLVLHRIPSCQMVFVASRHPGDDVLDYYARLGGPDGHRALERFHVLEVPEAGGRSVAAKLLDRPDLIDRVRAVVGGRPALIEPWNVTEAEVEVALRVGVPVNGTRPDLRRLGFKSEGRRVFRRAGVPHPSGVEDVRSVADVHAAISAVRAERPSLAGVVVKLDDSGSGDGNVVLDLRLPGWEDTLASLPEWYVRDLAAGGVVEELVVGARVSFPSAQLDIEADGTARLLATHEQVLGGPSGQVYLGCRFPADHAYAPVLARHAEAVGHELATRGVLGRVGVDFAAAEDDDGSWSVHALEINLRKGGTTHPYTTLRSLAPGRYDPAAATWTALDGSPRCYSATDNLVDASWRRLTPADAIEAVAAAGLEYDPAAGTGVVLHMLAGLAIDGRIGHTAIGGDPGEAGRLHEETARVLAEAAAVRR